MRAEVVGFDNPQIVPTNDGKLEAYAFVTFPDGERDTILVSLLHEKGYPLDDKGKVKKITEKITEAGFDILPSGEVKFSTFTPAETAVLGQKFDVIERKSPND